MVLLNEVTKFVIEQSAGYGIFCLLFTLLLGFVLWDSHRRETRWEDREKEFLAIIDSFKTDLQKIKECLSRLLSK